MSRRKPIRALFVTASGTGLGKTLVTAALCHQLRGQGRKVSALKPVMSGFSPSQFSKREIAASDAGILARSLGRAPDRAAIDAIARWRYRAPLAPNMAAKQEGKRLSFPALVEHCRRAASDRETFTLIEGVGGVMSPVTDGKTVLDWLAALRMPALLVAGNYLGGISHALTAVAAMRAARVELAGVIVSEAVKSEVPIAETLEFLRASLGPVALMRLPRIGGPDPWRRTPDLTLLLGPSPAP